MPRGEIGCHAQGGFGDGLGESRTYIENADAVAKTIAVIDIGKEIAFDIKDRFQGRGPLQSRFGKVDLPMIISALAAFSSTQRP